MVTARITGRVGAVGQVENQKRFPGFSICSSSVRIHVQELVVRRIVRHQDGRPQVDGLPPEEAEVPFHLAKLIGVGRTSCAGRKIENKHIERIIVVGTDDAIRIENLDRGWWVDCGANSGATLIRMYVGSAVGVAAVEMLRYVAVERRVEGVLDQSRVADAKPRHTSSERGRRTALWRTLRQRQSSASRPILVGIAAQDAVGRIDKLIGQGRYARLEEFLADLGPVAVKERHLELAQGRPLG